MIDVHCHLNFHAFKKDYDQVIQEAFQAGVTKIINVGTQLSSCKQAIELAKQYENLYAIVGVHPHHADKDELKQTETQTGTTWLQQLETLAKQPKVVAIGEIGLDNYRYQSNGIADPKMQQLIFLEQLQLAHKLKLPVQIHNRHAGKEIIKILQHHKDLLQDIPGMFHCFAGNMDILKAVLQMGFYVGFDGNITYKGLAPGEDTELKDLVKYAPLDRIVAETDSPYLAPLPHRGSRNMPKYVIIVGEFIAQLKNIPFKTVVAQTTKNVSTLFQF